MTVYPAYKQLWALIKYKPLLYFFNFALSLSVWLLLLVPAYVSKHFFDELTGHDSHQLLGKWGLLVLFAGAHVFRIIIFLINRFVDVTYSQIVGALIRNNIFNALYNRPNRVTGQSTGLIVNKIRDDVDEVGLFLGFVQLLDVVGSAVFSVIAMIMMLNINTMITLVVFLPLLGVTIIAYRSRLKVDELRKKNRETTEQTMGFINDVFSMVQGIKLAGAEDKIAKKLDEYNKKREKSNVSEALFGSFITSTYSNVVNIGTGIILLLAAHSISQGHFTVGDFATFSYFTTWVTTMIIRFGSLTANYNRLTVSFNRLSELTGSPKATVKHCPLPFGSSDSGEINDREETDTLTPFAELDVHNVTYLYPNSDNGIKDIHLSFKEKELTVITGRIGSGKTTFLKVLLGILPKAGGTMTWNHKELTSAYHHLVPPRITYVPQKPYLMSDSIKNNVLFGETFNEGEFKQILNMTSLDKDLRGLNEDIESEVGARGGKLSGGQKQRVALSRALYRRSDLLIVDDLSSALDIETEQHVWDCLLKSGRYKSIIAVSHSPSLLKKADKIIVLKEGRIIDQGKLEDLLHHSSEMQALWQFSV